MPNTKLSLIKIAAVFLLTFPVFTHTIQTSKLKSENLERFPRLELASVDNILENHSDSLGIQPRNIPYEMIPLPETKVHPAIRSSRILTKSSRDWGDVFVQILNERGIQDPIGVVMATGRNAQQCSQQWRQIVLNAGEMSRSRVPSILLATVDAKGNQSIVFCQNYRHFLTSLTSATSFPFPRNNTTLSEKSLKMDSMKSSPRNQTKGLEAMMSLVQMLPHKSSLVLFTTNQEDGSLLDSKWTEKLLRLTLQKSCKLNIFWCQEKQEVSTTNKNQWQSLAEKTKGKFVPIEASSEFRAEEEVSLVIRRGISGTQKIPLDVDPSITQLHIQISGTVQKATLQTIKANNKPSAIDLFAIHTHAADPPVPASPSVPSGLPQQLDNLQQNSRSSQGHHEELNVYVPIWGHLSPPGALEAGTPQWVLETRGVQYDVKVGGVRREGDGGGDNHRRVVTGMSDNNLASTSGLGSINKQDRADNVDQLEQRSDDFSRNTDSLTRNGDVVSRNGLPQQNDRILNGFPLPEWQWESMGPFQDRPWYLRSTGFYGAPYQTSSPTGGFSQNTYAPISPISLEVNQASSLTALPGETVQVMFDLTNNYEEPIRFYFSARDQFQYVRKVYPLMRWVDPYDSARITVLLEAQGAEGSTDVISFTAVGLETIQRNVYLHIGREIYDNTRPDISYNWKGDCENALTPDTCARASWGIEAVVQDTESGLLKVISKPLPLRFRSNFISGTREQVKVQYIASCCLPKLDLIAYDVKGNVNKYSINVENRWLSWSQILAIVFGSILLIILLVLIVYAIARCVQVRRKRNFLGE